MRPTVYLNDITNGEDRPPGTLLQRWRTMVGYAGVLLGIGVAYFACAKAGLLLASINPNATPIWPATGLALVAILLRGYRVCPAILLAAFLANATTAGSFATSATISLGNTLESLVGAWLIQRWSAGTATFDTAGGVTRFALISLYAPRRSQRWSVSAVSLSRGMPTRDAWFRSS